MMALDPIANATSKTVRRLRRRSLKERKRMVDTIRNERPRVVAKIAEAYSALPICPAIAWFATTMDTRIPAAPGMGRPTMYLEGFVGFPASPIERTLKRASRMAPQAVNTKD